MNSKRNVTFRDVSMSVVNELKSSHLYSTKIDWKADWVRQDSAHFQLSHICLIGQSHCNNRQERRLQHQYGWPRRFAPQSVANMKGPEENYCSKKGCSNRTHGYCTVIYHVIATSPQNLCDTWHTTAKERCYKPLWVEPWILINRHGPRHARVAAWERSGMKKSRFDARKEEKLTGTTRKP